MLRFLITIFILLASAFPASAAPYFAHYYLWWDTPHWKAKLGQGYEPLKTDYRLPANLAADECTASDYQSGNQLTDVPARDLGFYSQDDTAVLDRHIALAARAGLSGFVVSWAGTGKADQTTDSRAFSRRMKLLATRVNTFNSANKTHFALMVGY